MSTPPLLLPVHLTDLAVATATPKAPDANQDRSGVLRTPGGGAAIVCDGVGSLPESGAVAATCLDLAMKQIASTGRASGILTCPEHVAAAMDGTRDEVDGATTLLAVGADQDGVCYFTAAGNGSIVQIEEFLRPPNGPGLGFTELTLPHVAHGRGQAALRSYLPAPASGLEYAAGLLMARPLRPRLLLAGSDGVTTLEDRRLGLGQEGALWQPLMPPFVAVLNALTECWDDMLASHDAGAMLGAALQRGLDHALANGHLYDDATVGAVLVRPQFQAGEVAS